jgi:hypothetical protein
MSVVNTTTAKIAPKLGDMMARMQLGRQQRDEAPRSRTGTLYQPSGPHARAWQRERRQPQRGRSIEYAAELRHP